MLKSMLNIIRNKGIIHAKKDYNLSEPNMEIDSNKPFAVVRDDNKIIHQFYDFYEASAFSIKLNTSYKDNGIKAFSKVIKLSV